MVHNNNTIFRGDSWDPPYPVFFQAFGWLIASALSLETILGNAMVLLAYHLERQISKELNNRFIVSLAISDLIIGIEGIPFFTVYVMNGDRWPLGAIACETWLFLDYTLCLVSILTVLLITADRYLSVCHTAQYLKWQTPMKVQILIFLSWLLPALIFGLMIYGWPWIGEIEEQIEATSNGECYAPFLANPFVNMSMYLIYYWTTLVAMLILYKGIHKAAKKLEKRSRAREHRHIALLLTQRLGTQVGVGLMLHARKYHEEAMKTKKLTTAADVKDSGYATTNNTLSTNESTERRRSSFAILVKAVQSSQKLAQFRGRGTTFAFRTEQNDGTETTPRRNQNQLGINLQQQPQKLEQLPEQSGSRQLCETKCESKEDEMMVVEKSNEEASASAAGRSSAGFLQTLFAPISTFQQRRKKTKAERRAHKAFRTITFIVGLFAILWSPYYVVATIYGFCRGNCIPSILYNVSYYMCYLNSSLNPFAYALANRQFRSAFSRILRGNFRQSN